MGKVKILGYIVWFVVEVMSFLVKKVVVFSYKEKVLLFFVEYVRKDLESVVGMRQYEFYSQGIMIMFVEVFKVFNNGVYLIVLEVFVVIVWDVLEGEVDFFE